MKPTKVINLNAFHFEVKKDSIVFFGSRTEGFDSQRYEIRIKFNKPLDWFLWISKAMKRQLVSFSDDLIKKINSI